MKLTMPQGPYQTMRRSHLAPLLFMLLAALLSTGTSHAQYGTQYSSKARSGFEPSTRLPFRVIDERFVARALDRINDLTRTHYGSSLRQEKQHDLALLQRLLDEEKISRSDIELAQAAGVALGAMLATELDLDWIRYEDEAGVSRALLVRHSDQIFFPVSMISRRYKVGITPNVQLLYSKVVAKVERARALNDW